MPISLTDPLFFIYTLFFSLPHAYPFFQPVIVGILFSPLNKLTQRESRMTHYVLFEFDAVFLPEKLQQTTTLLDQGEIVVKFLLAPTLSHGPNPGAGERPVKLVCHLSQRKAV